MFAEMKNQFKLSFELKVDSPLCIKSGNKGIDPTLPDDCCIRSYKNGENVVFIPGSSIKGVIRTQCEKIFNVINNDRVCCDIFNRRLSCGRFDNDNENAAQVYENLCPACKMFGSTALGGRIKFKDAYPIDNKFKIGYRDGIGINRITGATQKGAKYDFEVVEDASFKVDIIGDNYELYQLKVLLVALNDIDEGYVTFGSSGTRGNGKMKVENVKLTVREYRTDINCLQGYLDTDIGPNVDYSKKIYFKEYTKENLPEILTLLDSVNIN